MNGMMLIPTFRNRRLRMAHQGETKLRLARFRHTGDRGPKLRPIKIIVVQFERGGGDRLEGQRRRRDKNG